MILIGSKAIKFWFPEFNREPKDIDYATSVESTTNKQKGVEYLYNPILVKWCNGSEIANPDELYTLKLSHTVGWKLKNNSWDKHVFDIQFLKSKGCKVIWPLFWDLYKFWETIHGKNKRSDLDMSSDEFFNNALTYDIPHDELHEILIKHPYFENQVEPTYKKILLGEVDVSMEKFNNLTEKEKSNIVIEEVMVMAIERFEKLGYLRAFKRMLDKFIINHAKIEEAIWVLENYKKLHKAPFDYIKFINYEKERRFEYA